MALLLLVVQPLLVKAPLLLGLLKSDPLVTWSGLGGVRHGLGGAPTIDPNIAFTSHALGSLAARLVLSGSSVWWNPYEGMGAPLAGEMQSAALFPPTWLLVFAHGQLWEQLLFQIVAGLATFLLLRRLGAGALGGWLGGTAFAFNGAFAWLANAVVNPICCLPVMLLGIEWLRPGPGSRPRWGGTLLAAGLAGSLYAGFPEVAYLDGLLVAAWMVLRVVQTRRTGGVMLALRVAAFGAAGCLLAAPIVASFFDYLRVGFVGGHTAAFAGDHLHPWHAGLLLTPYLPGGLLLAGMDIWGKVGGYAGVALAAFGAAGAVARRERGLRLLLAGWALFCLGAIYGIPPFTQAILLVPGMTVIAYYRYLDPSLLMALAVLAGLAVDDLVRDGGAVRPLRRAFMGAVIVAVVLAAIGVTAGMRPGRAVEFLPMVAQAGVVACLAVALWSRRLSPAARPVAVAALGAAEMVLLFAVPLSSYPWRRPVALDGVHYLQANLGLQRFVSVEDPNATPGARLPMAANYGSYFGVAEVNHNDLPVPRAWVDYIHAHLDPAADPIGFDPSRAAVLARLPAYAAIGTRFVIASPSLPMPGLTPVFGDAAMRIYRVPGERPYAAAPGCAVAARSRTEFGLRCTGASRLERLELWMPGWSARVNGTAAVVARDDIFQTVPVPAGDSTVSFAFAPPHLRMGLLAAVAGAVLYGVALLLLARREPLAAADDHD